MSATLETSSNDYFPSEASLRIVMPLEHPEGL
jgi:hypothetical protein